MNHLSLLRDYLDRCEHRGLKTLLHFRGGETYVFSYDRQSRELLDAVLRRFAQSYELGFDRWSAAKVLAEAKELEGKSRV